MAISGIKSLRVIERYIEKADQKRLARSGFKKWVNGKQVGKP